jgi:aryl-alcohol dehydrogenase-like predicted oxidoreductase
MAHHKTARHMKLHGRLCNGPCFPYIWTTIGITHWDTAEVYTGVCNDKTVYNETVVGKAIAAIGKREQLQIATKYMVRPLKLRPSIEPHLFAILLHSHQTQPQPTKHGNEMTEEMVLKACKESCDRLGVTYCDLYYVHRLHPNVPVEQQARAMKAVLDSGLAKVPTTPCCCALFS